MAVDTACRAGKYSVIMPTYNERKNIGIAVFLIDKYLSGARFGAHANVPLCTHHPGLASLKCVQYRLRSHHRR